jgi:hypothetical protein
MWHSLTDACPECRNLNGRVWEGQNLFQDTLWDSIWGNVWDLNIDMPLTHGGTGAFCRCQLEVQAHFNWDKIDELNQLEAVLKMESNPASIDSNDIKKGSSRSTTLEDIGVTL